MSGGERWRISRPNCCRRRAVTAMSSCNDNPVKCAIKPTTTAGCMKKESCNVGGAEASSTCCASRGCGLKESYNASGALETCEVCRRQYPGGLWRHCRTRSTLVGPLKYWRLSVYAANDADWPLCWPGGRGAENSSVGVQHCAGQDQRRPCNAYTCACGCAVPLAWISSGQSSTSRGLEGRKP